MDRVLTTQVKFPAPFWSSKPANASTEHSRYAETVENRQPKEKNQIPSFIENHQLQSMLVYLILF